MKKVLLFYVLFFSAFLVSGQIVNIEKKRKGRADGFQGMINGAFSIKETGSRILEYSNAVDLQYTKNEHTLILLNDLSFLDVDEGSLINNGFQHLRYNYTFKDSSAVTAELFGQHQYNEKKLLKRRVLLGSGLRFRLAQNENLHVFFAPLAMYENELLADSSGTVETNFRLDAYVNMYFSVNDLVDFKMIAYYQPAFNNFSDLRLSGEAGFRLNFTKRFSFDSGYSVDYDSLPPEDIQNIFFYWKNRLVFKF